ncbi:hypothetical protein NDU88_000198 [Pleurodeles waltl]|uniref:Uncharacterized protein n=1 Tax=Pleurodeles waltl TaxID=8319 RepID=A0AAV7LC95_PLEWA|nr:hypothetical protein NDU88_000198 [Pleurodeles waltl]
MVAPKGCDFCWPWSGVEVAHFTPAGPIEIVKPDWVCTPARTTPVLRQVHSSVEVWGAPHRSSGRCTHPWKFGEPRTGPQAGAHIRGSLGSPTPVLRQVHTSVEVWGAPAEDTGAECNAAALGQARSWKPSWGGSPRRDPERGGSRIRGHVFHESSVGARALNHSTAIVMHRREPQEPAEKDQGFCTECNLVLQ